MLGKVIIKAVKATVKKSDKELQAIKKQVEELDTMSNCIYFDRFTEVIRGAK